MSIQHIRLLMTLRQHLNEMRRNCMYTISSQSSSLDIMKAYILSDQTPVRRGKRKSVLGGESRTPLQPVNGDARKFILMFLFRLYAPVPKL